MIAGSGSARRTSLIIATYNWKEALGAVLATVRAQWELPGEVVIADDGSRTDTGALIAHAAISFPVPLRHIWHEDAGFRLGTIRNRAMAAANGDYLIQIEGDLLLHPGFVQAHRRFAKRGTYAQGSRALLCEAQTQRYLSGARRATELVSPFSRGVRNRANGYNEDIERWGREDSELAARLINSGVRQRNLKFVAVAWHLHHHARSVDAVQRNHAIFERTVRERLVRCAHGIDQYLVWPPDHTHLAPEETILASHHRAEEEGA